MHDKFEKEVQRKMEELNLVPSALVWEKIEMVIKPEKRRRRIFFWIFLGVILLGGSGAVYYSLNKNKQDPNQHQVAKTNELPAASQHIPSSSNIHNKPIKKEQTVIVNEKKQTTGDLPEPSIQIKNSTAPNPISLKKIVTQGKGKGVDGLRRSAFSGLDKKTSGNQENAPLLQSNVQTYNNASGTAKLLTNDVQQSSDTIAINKPSLDSAAKTNEKQNNLPSSSIDSSIKKKVAAAKKWKKQVLVNIGVSSHENFALLNTVTRDAIFYQSPSTGVGSSLGSNSYRAPKLSRGPAFSIGVGLLRELSRKTDLAAGLQYSFYSTKTVDSASYNNQFHTIEVPVTFSYRPFQKLPMVASVSVSYGYLLSTNAKTVSPASNAIVPKNDFNRNMLPIGASLQADLFSKKKISLRIGPAVQYNLAKTRKTNDGTPQHLFFAGIKSALNF